jgi:hypothetical protein
VSQDTMFQGDMDPEIAALIGAGKAPSSSPPASSAPTADFKKLFASKLQASGSAAPPTSTPTPDFKNLFADSDPSGEPDTMESPEVDLTTSGFPQITKPYETVPHKSFDDPEYYKKTLSNEGDPAQRVHGILQKYVAAKDPKDRAVFRQQMIPAFWDFLASVARKTPGKLPEAKRYLLRFGILHPTLISPEDRALFSKIVVENELSQPVYYLDEWFKAVGTGVLKNSATDEVRVAKTNEQVHLQQLFEKAVGKRDGARNLLKAKNDERASYEAALLEKAKALSIHAPVPAFPEIGSVYSEGQRHEFSEIQEILKNLVRVDREFDKFLEELQQAIADVETLDEKVRESGGNIAVDVKSIDTEFDTVKQMAKLTIGRQGNHFPILTREYFRSMPNEIATRENIISQLTWIESVDSEAFCRSYKNRLNRIVPFVLLLPTYGDTGICWEAFDRFNRATSRGRIAVPMYPKNLAIAVLSAVADLRWQVAKEKASYYWMEEGLTGNYYQQFVAKKVKGDVKEYFIQDYILWMTKESDGVQKLEKEVRGIFWRFIPFSKEIKEKLKTRSYIYQELYQRDLNRTMSDGY